MTNYWKSASLAGLVVAAVIGFNLVREQSTAADNETSGRPADEKAIKEASIAFARAFEKGDADAIASFWTEEGEYADEDSPPIRGRAALAKAYAGFFAKRPEIKVEGKMTGIRFLGKDTAVEEGIFTVKAKDSPPMSSNYSALYVRQEGRWLMAMLKEWSDEESNKGNVEDIAWLIGTWESDSAEAVVRTTYEWAEPKRFIRCHYSIKGKKDNTSNSGTQIIGVDPAVGLIRGWTFDSNGGVGEATWTWDGERWLIDSHGTLPDGSGTSSVNFLAQSGNDAFTWRSVKRTANGQPLPDLATVKVKRVSDPK